MHIVLVGVYGDDGEDGHDDGRHGALWMYIYDGETMGRRWGRKV